MKKLDDIDHIAIQVDDIKKSLNWYLKNLNARKFTPMIPGLLLSFTI